ncbi:hypothetical protein K440DRAFT_632698 [Wilcoxina mikolae CBS 423.85]|nr:hypothetical protein K440DRAFT_632698 [Wilcoxina mikolae CBS 423.85]
MNSDLENFILFPLDDWLRTRCRILRESMALSGTALLERLVQFAVHSIESRGIPIQESERQSLTENIRTRLPNLGLPDYPAAAREVESRSNDHDALREQLNYLVNQVAGSAPGYNAEISPSDTLPIRFENLNDIKDFLDELGLDRMEVDAEDSSNTGAADSEAPQQYGPETPPTSVSGDSLHLTPQKKAPKIFGCGYCSKTFSKRFELTRHWVQAVNSCTEKLISFPPHVPGTCCEKCGRSVNTFNPGNKLEGSGDHENDFDTIIHTDNLPTKWRRKYPKLADQDDDDISYHNSGISLDRPHLFVGKYRKSEAEDWKIMHVQFRDHPNRPKFKYSESVASGSENA